MSLWRSIRMAAVFDLLLWKGPLTTSELTKEAAREMADPPPESLVAQLPWTPDGARSRLQTMVARDELRMIPAVPKRGEKGKPGYEPRTHTRWEIAWDLERRQQKDALLSAAYHRWP